MLDRLSATRPRRAEREMTFFASGDARVHHLRRLARVRRRQGAHALSGRHRRGLDTREARRRWADDLADDAGGNRFREEIGDGRFLMMDATGVGRRRGDRPHPRVTRFDPLWMEEPTNPDDILRHARIAHSIDPIGIRRASTSTTASCSSSSSQADAIRYCQIDAARLGGVNEVLSVLFMAAKPASPAGLPQAGDAAPCEYVHATSRCSTRSRSRRTSRSHRRVRGPPARALRRTGSDQQRRLRRAGGPGVQRRHPSGVADALPVPRWRRLGRCRLIPIVRRRR